MSKRLLKAWFYERESALEIAVFKEDYDRMIKNLKELAAGNQEIPSYFTLRLTDTTSVLISVK